MSKNNNKHNNKRTERKEKKNKMTNCKLKEGGKNISIYIFGCLFQPSHLRFSGSICLKKIKL